MRVSERDIGIDITRLWAEPSRSFPCMYVSMYVLFYFLLLNLFLYL